MAYELKITDVQPIEVTADATHLLEVTATLYKDGKDVGVRRFGYPLETTADQIKEELANVVLAMLNDDEIHEKGKALAAGLQNVEAVKAQLIQTS